MCKAILNWRYPISLLINLNSSACFKQVLIVIWWIFFPYSKACAFKGYLRYKTIISRNVSSEALVKSFFRRKVIFRSQDIQVFVFLTIPWFTLSVTSWWVLVHETGCISEYIFRTTTNWVTKLGQLIDKNKGNNFHGSFEQFGGLAR